MFFKIILFRNFIFFIINNTVLLSSYPFYPFLPFHLFLTSPPPPHPSTFPSPLHLPLTSPPPPHPSTSLSPLPSPSTLPTPSTLLTSPPSFHSLHPLSPFPLLYPFSPSPPPLTFSTLPPPLTSFTLFHFSIPLHLPLTSSTLFHPSHRGLLPVVKMVPNPPQTTTPIITPTPTSTSHSNIAQFNFDDCTNHSLFHLSCVVIRNCMVA